MRKASRAAEGSGHGHWAPTSVRRLSRNRGCQQRVSAVCRHGLKEVIPSPSGRRATSRETRAACPAALSARPRGHPPPRSQLQRHAAAPKSLWSYSCSGAVSVKGAAARHCESPAGRRPPAAAGSASAAGRCCPGGSRRAARASWSPSVAAATVARQTPRVSTTGMRSPPPSVAWTNIHRVRAWRVLPAAVVVCCSGTNLCSPPSLLAAAPARTASPPAR